MAFVFNNIKKGIFVALIASAIYMIYVEAIYGGCISWNGWTYTRMLFGVLLVSLGYSLSSVVYFIEKIVFGLQVLIQMLCGTLMFVIVATAFQWYVKNDDIYNIAITVIQAAVALIYLAVEYWQNRQVAEEINRKIADRRG